VSLDRLSIESESLRDLPGLERCGLGIVVYSYPGDYRRLRVSAPLGLQAICASPGSTVFVTVRSGEQPPESELPDAIPMVLHHPAGYEFLPDKTIAMLRWFLENTRCTHLMKLDTDVVLDRLAVESLAANLPGLDYEGVGVWEYSPRTANLRFHQGRCTTPALNQQLLDASWSAAGSTYATGKCYLLSRRAVEGALRAYDEGPFEIPEARRRCDSRAFQEDVMLGYLLQRAGFVPRQSLNLLSLPPGDAASIGRVLRWALASARGRGSASGRMIGFVADNRAMSMVQRSIVKTVMWWRAVFRLSLS
jgi:hypothetical protein